MQRLKSLFKSRKRKGQEAAMKEAACKELPTLQKPLNVPELPDECDLCKSQCNAAKTKVWERIFAIDGVTLNHLFISKNTLKPALACLYNSIDVRSQRILRFLSDSPSSGLAYGRNLKFNVFTFHDEQTCFIEETMLAIAKLLGETPNLISFDAIILPQCVQHENGMAKLAEAIAALPHLRHVDIAGPTADTALRFCNDALCNHELARLKVDIFNLTDEETVIGLYQGPYNMPRLDALNIELRLDANGPNDLERFAKAEMTNVRSLVLSAPMTSVNLAAASRLAEHATSFTYTSTGQVYDLSFLPTVQQTRPFAAKLTEITLSREIGFFKLANDCFPPNLTRLSLLKTKSCPIEAVDKLQDRFWLPKLQTFTIDFARRNAYISLTAPAVYHCHRIPRPNVVDFGRYQPSDEDKTLDKVQAEAKQAAQIRDLKLEWSDISTRPEEPKEKCIVS